MKYYSIYLNDGTDAKEIPLQEFLYEQGVQLVKFVIYTGAFLLIGLSMLNVWSGMFLEELPNWCSMI